MTEESLLDEECLALESIFEDRFTRLQPDKIRLVILPEGAEDNPGGKSLVELQPILFVLSSSVICSCRQQPNCTKLFLIRWDLQAVYLCT